MLSREKIMKKVIIAIIAFAVLATGVLFAVAQRSGDGKMGGWGKRGGHHHGIGMALRGLDLTDEQKVKVKQIVDESKTKTQPIRESLKANHQKLDEATANGAFDEAAISAIATEKGNLSAQMTIERARVKSQVFALLTDDQKVKAAEMKSKMQERFKGKMKDHESDSDAPVGSEL
jgi:periplasmic protein CpxP/Spy